MLAYWDDVLQSMLAFCVVMGMFQFFKILQFNRTINIIVHAVKFGFVQLLLFGIVLVLIIVTFIQPMYVVYNEKMIEFSTFVKSMNTVFTTVLGKFNLNNMMLANPYLTPIVCYLFNVIVVIAMLNLFLSTIIGSFLKARMNRDTINEVKMTDFLEAKIIWHAQHFESSTNEFLANLKKKVAKNHQSLPLSLLKIQSFLKENNCISKLVVQ
jgi:hypothetical protein